MDNHRFHTPVGRFVSGSLTEKRATDMNNRPIDPDKQRYEFGLAIRKDDPGVGPLIQGFGTYALQSYANAPHIQQRIQNWFKTFDGFSMKVSDGDAPNQKGVVNQNTAGCYVLWFSTSLDINAANAQNTQIDIGLIKRGYYVDVAGTAAANGLVDHNAGIYMNPSWVRLVGEGDVITGGISAEEAFASAPAPQLPPGARPVGSAPPAPAGAPGVGFTPPATGLPATGGQTAPAGTVAAPVLGGTASPGETTQPYPGILLPGLPG